jgi:hypothetical protein
VLLSGATFAFTAATGLLQISHGGGTNLAPGAGHSHLVLCEAASVPD